MSEGLSVQELLVRGVHTKEKSKIQIVTKNVIFLLDLNPLKNSKHFILGVSLVLQALSVCFKLTKCI